MLTTIFWISASLAFEPRVLISLPISCVIKPSFLPCESVLREHFDEMVAVLLQPDLLLSEIHLFEIVDQLLLKPVRIGRHAIAILPAQVIKVPEDAFPNRVDPV